MSTATLFIVLLALSSAAYYVGRRRAFAVAGDSGRVQQLHSRPTYYGALTAIWCGIPALLLFGFWLAFESTVITQLVVSDLPENIRSLTGAELNLFINKIKNLVSGNIVSGAITTEMQRAADHYRSLQTTSKAALTVVVICLAMLGLVTVRARIKPGLRARRAPYIVPPMGDPNKIIIPGTDSPGSIGKVLEALAEDQKVATVIVRRGERFLLKIVEVRAEVVVGEVRCLNWSPEISRTPARSAGEPSNGATITGTPSSTPTCAPMPKNLPEISVC